MNIIKVNPKDNVHLKIVADKSILMEIRDYFSFDVPGAKFTPLYKSRMWDGKIYLFNLLSKELPVGLLDYLKLFAADNGYIVDDSAYIPICENITIEQVTEFCKALNVTSLGVSIEVRDYQIEAIHIALTSGRRLLLSPTASGKSLIIYCLIRWYQLKGYKQLIIVPTTSLVEQMKTDFIDYSTANKWDPAQMSVIYGGNERVNDAQVVISTWQSLYKLPEEFFAPFQCIYGDEAHLFKAKSLTTILNKCRQAPHRFGTTGTLDGTHTHKLVLEGIFGPVYKVTTTRELIDTKQIADLKIWCIQLNHNDQDKNFAKRFTYQQEMDFLVSHERRNTFIKNLAVDLKGNTLLLFVYIEKHGKILYDMINEQVIGTRKVFFVHGGVDAAAREEVRKITETETNAIIVASFGTFATGTNIRNLHNVVFASPAKSRIRNLQSIGRGLRRSDTKDFCDLYDISDNLTWKSKKNHTWLHMIERVKIYAEEQFNYTIAKVNLK